MEMHRRQDSSTLNIPLHVSSQVGQVSFDGQAIAPEYHGAARVLHVGRGVNRVDHGGGRYRGQSEGGQGMSMGTEM